MKLPILNLDSVLRYEQCNKVREEYKEWNETLYTDVEHDIEESLDVIQAMFGYLLKIVPDLDELTKHVEKHRQKLESRNHELDGYIELHFDYK